MKKILSILGTIGLTATSTTSLISCQKPNNNKNGENNKPEPTPEPENSNWKIVNNSKENLEKEFNQKNDKWYILIYKKQIILKEKYNRKDKITISKFDNYEILKFGKRILQHFFNKPLEWSIYRWDGLNEPETPYVDKDTGKITDWKEQKD